MRDLLDSAFKNGNMINCIELYEVTYCCRDGISSQPPPQHDPLVARNWPETVSTFVVPLRPFFFQPFPSRQYKGRQRKCHYVFYNVVRFQVEELCGVNLSLVGICSGLDGPNNDTFTETVQLQSKHWRIFSTSFWNRYVGIATKRFYCDWCLCVKTVLNRFGRGSSKPSLVVGMFRLRLQKLLRSTWMSLFSLFFSHNDS